MRKVLLTAALAVLSACASDTVDYKSATTLPPLEVPPDLTSPARDNRYAVPETARSTTLSGYQAERRDPARVTALTPVLPENDRMKIERSGNQRWLVVQEPPEKLWPLIKEFWQASGFLLKRHGDRLGRNQAQGLRRLGT
jgi:outer membrane protein assembly factor BamC